MPTMLPTIIDQEPLQGPKINSRHHSDVSSAAHTRAIEMVRRYIESMPQPVPFRKELRCGRFWRAVWTEFLVTLLFLVIGCGSGIRWSSLYLKGTETIAPTVEVQSTMSEDLKASLALGLTVAALVQSTAHISGCHLNPAVSITLLVTRNITPLRTVSYVLAQCLGATVGAAILYGLTPPEVRSGGLSATVVHPNVHPSQAFGVEFLITLFILVILNAAYDAQVGESCFKGPAIGVAYTVGHLFGYRYTGASMNPARSLALALITNSWKNHWVYWVGPILGGVIGGITYEYIRDTSDHGSTSACHQRLRQHHRNLPYRQEMKRDQSALGSHNTELTLTSNDYRV